MSFQGHSLRLRFRVGVPFPSFLAGVSATIWFGPPSNTASISAVIPLTAA